MAMLELDCDVLVPAAREEQITRGKRGPTCGAGLIVEAANGPTTPAADRILAERGITVIPDILANAGGVIVSYFEWVQSHQKYSWEALEVRERLRTQMRGAFARVRATADQLECRQPHRGAGLRDQPRVRGRQAEGDLPMSVPRPPRCRGWQQEAALSMLENNLHPDVAENPAELIVYGGIGKAARNQACLEAIKRELIAARPTTRRCWCSRASRWRCSRPTSRRRAC